MAGLIGSLLAPPTGIAKEPTILKKLQPQYNSNATRAVYMYGPYKLASRKVSDAAGNLL
jgi:hypothetical protein